MTDIFQLILELRPDLCKRFGFNKPENKLAYLIWLFTTGINEYAILKEDKDFLQKIPTISFDSTWNKIPTNLQRIIFYIRPDVQATFPLPNKLPEFLEWFYTYGIIEHNLWKWLLPEEKKYALQQPEPWIEKIAALAFNTPESLPPIPIKERPWGVNLIGYAYGQLGIGEDVRMAGRALLAAQVPMTMVNFKPGSDIGQNDQSMIKHITPEGHYAINIFCLTALEHGRFWTEKGNKQIVERYNIGYWPWELSQWPTQWHDLIYLVDEIWVSTQHTFDALEPVIAAMPNPLSLRIMPMAVELGAIAMRKCKPKTVRKHFHLPQHAYLFCFSFDLNSSIHRKNPQAAVEAFLRAFPISYWTADQVGLVIKVHRPKQRNKIWDKLKTLAECDTRIHIIEETLDRPMLLALYQACNCFISLHRAEGFGRGIAEALQLGLHIITTNYSGNMDFCKYPPFSKQVDLIRYQLIPVKRGQYPYGTKQVWANADINHAADCMRNLPNKNSLNYVNNVKNVKNDVDYSLFSTRIVGQRYRKRLQEIYKIIKNY